MKRCSACGTEFIDEARFCPSCGPPATGGAADAESPLKTAPGTAGTSLFRRVGLVLIPLILVVGGYIFYSYLVPSVQSVIKKQPVVALPTNYDSNTVSMTNVSYRLEGSDIVFSLADLRQYRLVRFEYPTRTIVRAVMAYIDPEGRAVTAISLSDHCGSTEFQIKNNQIYCAHCPSHWDMMTMEAYACCGNYYPDPIPSKVVGNEVHIPKKEVEEWAGRL